MDSSTDFNLQQPLQSLRSAKVKSKSKKTLIGCNQDGAKLFQVLVVATLFVGLTLPSVLAFSSLYTYKDEGIAILDNTNFTSFASNNPTALWIEFYNSWCGHCIRFAPIWKEFAKDIKEWKPVVQLAVIDCAEDRNQDICREYEVYLYPSVRFFWINNEVIRDYSVPKNSEQTSKNNSHLLGKQYEGDLDSTEPLMKGLIHNILDHSSKGVPKNWPSLAPIDAESKDELVQKIGFRERISVILLIDDSLSQLGPQVILDFSAFQDKVMIVWLSHISNDLKHQKLIKELLPESLTSPQFPALVELDLISQTTKLLCCPDGQGSKDKNIRSTFGQIIRHRFIPETEAKAISAHSLSRPVGTTERSLIGSPTTIDILQPVHMVDLFNALRYSLFNQIPSRKKLDSAQLAVFKDFLQVIDRFFPFGEKDAKSIEFIKLLLKWSTTLSHYLESDELIAIMNKFEDDYSLPDMAKYKSCAGSDPKYRGYPCSLWTLFHTLTVNEYLLNKKTPGYYFSSDDSGSPHQVLQVMRSFITTFFGCTDCAENFKKESSNLDNELPHFNSSVLWLWETHNRVNKRLHGDASEDPVHPKIQFPGRYSCPACYNSSPHQPTFKEAEVFNFLIEHYRPSNIVRESDVSQSKVGRSKAEAVFQKMSKVIEFDHDHKHIGDGDQVVLGGRKVIWSTYYSLLNRFDIGIFVALYLFSAVIIIYLFFYFKTRYKKKISSNKTVNINIRYFP